MMWFGHGMGFGLGTAGILLTIAFWFGLLVLGFFAVRALSKTHSSRAADVTSQTPLEILKARYARGEISKAEYEEMRAALT